MTKKRAAKKRTRSAAAAAGTNYTTAKRARQTLTSQDGGGGGVRWPGLPTAAAARYPKRLRTDLAWADLVFDARRGYEIAVDDLARVLPEDGDWAQPGHPALPGSGVLEVPWLPDDSSSGSGSLRVSVHIVAEPDGWGHSEHRLRGKPGLLLLVTYPDGLRIGLVALHSANYQGGPDEVWAEFLDRATVCGDGLSQFVASGRGGPVRSTFPHTHDTEVAAALVRRGAALLRDAVYDLAAWLPRDREDFGHEEAAGCPEIDRLFAATTLGFTDQAKYDRLMAYGAWSGWLNDARAAGFDTSDEESLAWIEAALPWDFEADTPGDAWTDLLGPWRGIARTRVHSLEAVRGMAKARSIRATD